mmetsp:Transcript_20677/g.28548  ORF Transcript_20677/g.28548 Transcript_20677/m.28548 type:complete len:97 (+) Transcript_20677:1180-1470(+)
MKFPSWTVCSQVQISQRLCLRFITTNNVSFIHCNENQRQQQGRKQRGCVLHLISKKEEDLGSYYFKRNRKKNFKSSTKLGEQETIRILETLIANNS